MNWKTILLALALTSACTFGGYRLGLDTFAPSPIASDSERATPTPTDSPRRDHTSGRANAKALIKEIRSLLSVASENTNDRTALARIDQLRHELALEDIPDFLAIAENASGIERGFLMRFGIRRLSEVNPEIALDYCMENGHLRLVLSPLREIAKRDPKAALEKGRALRDQLPGVTLFGNVVANAFEQWSKNDSVQAFAEYESLTSGTERSWAATGLRKLLDDPESKPGLLDYARSLDPGKARTELTEKILSKLAKTDEQEAFDWMGRLTLEGKELDEAASRIASGWSERDPVASANWLMENTETTERLHYNLCGFALNWANRDEAGWRNWMSDLGYSDAQMAHYKKIASDGSSWSDVELFQSPEAAK